ncbi:MAG TPA: winged helix-turn-helix domain-containing protein [Actinomycetota bacterium]
MGPLAISPNVVCASWLDGRPLDVSARQVLILASLVRAHGRLLTRAELYERVTGAPMGPRSRAIDTDVWRIRRALGSYGRFLRSVRKVGYALDVDGLARCAARQHVVTNA